MNESELENELRRLLPASPSRDLEARIGRDLADLHRTETPVPAREASGMLARWLDRLLWSGLGAAATALVMVGGSPTDARLVVQSAAPVSPPALQPVLVSEEDLGWRDEGVLFNAEGQPMLKLRRLAMQRRAWADVENAGVVQLESPRQEVMWMPVTLH